MTTVHTLFDCKHEKDIEVRLDDDVVVPGTVRGIGKCPDCMEEDQLIAISGVAPGPGGRVLTLDSIMMIAIEG
ncbi:MAG: hypothetical protein M3Z66_20200 [Chloroflexota bacterium]|nr:hypothetical protein [Chloroflexota bacterium]